MQAGFVAAAITLCVTMHVARIRFDAMAIYVIISMCLHGRHYMIASSLAMFKLSCFMCKCITDGG